MKKLITYTAMAIAVIVLALVMTPKATGTTEPIRTTESSTTQVELARRIHGLRISIVIHTSKTHHYQELAGLPKTKSSHAERHTKSVAFLHWINTRWYSRQKAARRYYVKRYLPQTNDWQTAVRIVQRTWPGTSSFLLNCSAAEGSHGGWIWNGSAPYGQPHYGSDAGGWMQYFRSTFDSHYTSALALARQEHLPVPPPGSDKSRAGVWRESPLAQAFAAGWGYHFNHSAWTGDPSCW